MNSEPSFITLALQYRFAGWVEGESHVSDEEVSFYIEEPTPEPLDLSGNLTEDEIDFRLSSP